MSQEHNKREASHLQHEAEHSRPKRRSASVMSYLAILFGAAFLLLLLSYFMQQRTSEETISGLKDSVTSAQSVGNLIEQNTALAEKNDALQQQLDALEQQAAQWKIDEKNLRDMVDGISAQTEGMQQAMDWFWQLNQAYVQGKYTLCRTIITTLEDGAHGSPLKDFLPTESLTDNERFSPYERYQEIYARVN